MKSHCIFIEIWGLFFTFSGYRSRLMSICNCAHWSRMISLWISFFSLSRIRLARTFWIIMCCSSTRSFVAWSRNVVCKINSPKSKNKASSEEELIGIMIFGALNVAFRRNLNAWSWDFCTCSWTISAWLESSSSAALEIFNASINSYLIMN
jgi:hypothetical protein